MFYFYATWFCGDGEPVADEDLPVLHLKEPPYRLGTYEDTDGERWDVHAIAGKRIFARRYRDYYFPTETNAHPPTYQEWTAYRWTAARGGEE